MLPQRFSTPTGEANHRPVWATNSHAVTTTGEATYSQFWQPQPVRATTDEAIHRPMATHCSIEKTYHYHRIIQLLKLEEPD